METKGDVTDPNVHLPSEGGVAIHSIVVDRWKGGIEHSWKCWMEDNRKTGMTGGNAGGSKRGHDRKILQGFTGEVGEKLRREADREDKGKSG